VIIWYYIRYNAFSRKIVALASIEHNSYGDGVLEGENSEPMEGERIDCNREQ
jgi:hypothetical protein